MPARRLALCLAFLLASVAGAAESRNRYSESEVAVALLYNITKFVRWPAGAFDAPTSALNLCTVAADAYRPALQALESRMVQQHPVRVLEMSPGATTADMGCHVLFFPDEIPTAFERELQQLGDSPVLTVGNFREFSEQGGMLSMTRKRNRTHILINATASERAGLEYNSQLLALATVIREAAEEE